MADIRPPQIDFSPLIGMGQAFGDMRRQQRLSGALSSLGPDATWQDRANAIMSIDPKLGVQMLRYGEQDTVEPLWDSDPYGRLYDKRSGSYKDGGAAPGAVPGGAAPGTTNPHYFPHKNQDESKAGSFHKEAAAANTEIEQLGNVPNEENWLSGAANAVESSADGGIIGSVAHGFTQPERKQYNNAASRFINAINRRESGAQVKPSEWQDAYNRYLPRKGDDAETIRRKAEARRIKLNAIAGEAGPMYDPKAATPPLPLEDPARRTVLPQEPVEASVTDIPGAIADPRGPYTGPAPVGQVMTDGRRRIQKHADGYWYDMATGKRIATPRP